LTGGRHLRYRLPGVQNREIFLTRKIGHIPIVPFTWIHRVLSQGANITIQIRGRDPWNASGTSAADSRAAHQEKTGAR
jgi:hypothetical protein